MTETELAALTELVSALDRHTDTMDVYLPNTDAMWSLTEEMRAWNMRMPLADYLALPMTHPERWERPGEDAEIIAFHSCVMLPFLYEKVKAMVPQTRGKVPVNYDRPYRG